MTRNAVGKKIGSDKPKKALIIHRIRKQTKKKK